MKKVLLITLFLSVAVILSNGQGRGTVAQGRQTDAVKRLLAERVDTFRSIEETFRQQHEAGHVSTDEVHRAVLDRLEAELDLADTKQARIPFLEKQVEEAKALEGIVRKRQKVASASDLDVLRAKAFRLNFEVALERERASNR